MSLILLNKPYRVLSQFTDSDGRATLAEFVDTSGVYPAGRLDFDSEGLILLTDNGRLQARISQPRAKLAKQYWVQVEGTALDHQIQQLARGVVLKDGAARALWAQLIPEPENLWTRTPPIRERKSIPSSWISIGIDEGRNRQIRRMVAAVGLPALRLVRCGVGPWSLEGLQPGEHRRISDAAAWRELQSG